MANNIAEKFIEALYELETNSNVEKIVSLFSEDSEVGNVAMLETSHENLDARQFWTNYRNTFGEVRSEFRNKIISENTSALEWTTEGTNKNGLPVSYEGVSILETDGEIIKRFFAYFNPGKLGEQIAEQSNARGS
jgi:hypothetical protein